MTGASSGVGAATAVALAAAGARVGLVARQSPRLDALSSQVPGAITAPADVTEFSQVRSAVDLVAAEFGGLDVVVNAAGVNRAAAFRDADPTDLRVMVATNVLGPMYVCRAAVPYLLESESADVVNVGSMSARRVLSLDTGVYAATKAALAVWSATLAEELGAAGIRVMTVTPGMIDTAFAEGTVDPTKRSERREQSAALGLAPEEVAEQILLMLALPRSIRLHEMAVMSTRQRR